jgi:hypothetical protein
MHVPALAARHHAITLGAKFHPADAALAAAEPARFAPRQRSAPDALLDAFVLTRLAAVRTRHRESSVSIMAMASTAWLVRFMNSSRARGPDL